MVKLIEVTEQESNEKLPYDVAEDLIVYMRNDPLFYRRHLYPALVDAQQTIKNKNKYNKRKMLPVIDLGLQSYVNKYNIKQSADQLMNDHEKLECAARLLSDEKDNFEKGTY
jgi:hypothetical protein